MVLLRYSTDNLTVELVSHGKPYCIKVESPNEVHFFHIDNKKDAEAVFLAYVPPARMAEVEVVNSLN